MNVHGGYLRVTMCVVRPQDMVGHGNGAQTVLMGRHRGVLCVQNTQQNNTVKQEMSVGVVLTNGHTGHNTGHEQGPLNPNKREGGRISKPEQV